MLPPYLTHNIIKQFKKHINNNLNKILAYKINSLEFMQGHSPFLLSIYTFQFCLVNYLLLTSKMGINPKIFLKGKNICSFNFQKDLKVQDLKIP